MSGSTGRFGRPRGRFFSTRDEADRIDRDVASYQEVYGTSVLWFFFDRQDTVVDDLYDEGSVVGGKRYLTPPLRLPVLSAVPVQGDQNSDDQGFATYDRVELRISYDQARAVGFGDDLIRDREARLLDRFVYRGKVFDVLTLQTSGHFEQNSTDTVFSVTGVQLRPDELVDSPTFAFYETA